MSAPIIQTLQEAAANGIQTLFGAEVPASEVAINVTPTEYEGQFTVVVFPYVRFARKRPEETGDALGAYLLENVPEVAAFNTVKGFLNLVLSDAHWFGFLREALAQKTFGQHPPTAEKIVLEYCGPNTNKPLHLGHIRNMLLGWSTAEILSAAGYDVHKVNIYNDRGIAICKSMAAYEAEGQGATPASTGTKGDHFVGSYYVAYNRLATEQAAEHLAAGMEKREAEKQTPIYQRAQEMLLAWEANDPNIRELWSRMNGWVYEGFQETFRLLGVDFEKDYLESETYLLGRDIVLEGVQQKAFDQHDDGSVRANLSEEGLDEKLLLRSDGSSMYITQDLGTAELRYRDYQMDRSIYVVGSEQDYHFKVLQVLLKRLNKPYADGIVHLSYGMVDLPTGKMKSREGTTVDADDLVADMIQTARSKTEELGKVEGFSAEEADALYATLGLGALKYFILKVDPRKRILFNPEESIELQGNTGPFIQYTNTRIQSMLRKAGDAHPELPESLPVAMEDMEVRLLALLSRYPGTIQEAASTYSPAAIANYAYEVAKTYNQFYDRLPVLKAPSPAERDRRLSASLLTGRVLTHALSLLGIGVPDRM